MKRISTLTAVAAAAAATAGLSLAPGAVSGAAQAAAGTAAAGLPVIHVATNGKKITVSGALQSGGVKIISTVTRERTGSPTFVRLDAGVTVAQFERALPAIAKDQNHLYGIGQVVMSADAPRGTSWVQASLAPGHYVALDIASSGAPAQTTFSVTRAASPARLPRPSATVASIDFAFRGATRLHDGELVRFANRGFVVHMIVALRAGNRASAVRIARLLKAGHEGRAGKLVRGSTTFDNLLSHGAYQQLVVHSKPGYWVLVCFMETQDGRDHTRLGMERVIHIAR